MKLFSSHLHCRSWEKQREECCTFHTHALSFSGKYQFLISESSTPLKGNARDFFQLFARNHEKIEFLNKFYESEGED